MQGEDSKAARSGGLRLILAGWEATGRPEAPWWHPRLEDGNGVSAERAHLVQDEWDAAGPAGGPSR